MFTSNNFTNAEQISLAQEIAKIGQQNTPFTSLLMAKGVEKATSTIYTFREKALSHDEDISAEEGADTTEFTASARRELNNVLQIFKKGVSISGSAQAMKSGQLDSEVADRLLELKVNMERALINGVKDDGSVSGIRKMAGLISLGDETNDVAVTGDVTEDTIKEMARKLWNQDLATGEIYALVNADIKEQIDAIYKDRYNYNHVTTNFGAIADSVNTNYGVVNFILSKHVPADKIAVFNDSYVDLAYLREPSFEPLAKTGDSVKGQVVAESTLAVKSPKAVGVVTVA
ncbi:SU10 major capsid protein [Oceanobacillus sp. CAU 1775]